MNSSASAPRSATELAPPSAVELEVRRVRELISKHQVSAALTVADGTLISVPHNRDLLHLKASCLRQLGRLAEALSVLDRLEELHPRFSHLYQERGRCYVLLRDAPRAIEAFLRAVNINPALPGSWTVLQGLYRMTGDAKSAATAAEHVATLRDIPPPVLQASSLFANGDLAAAETIVRGYLQRHGNHVEAMRLLARIGMAQEALDDADLLLAAVLELAPGYIAARFDFANVLVRRHKYREAHEQVRLLLEGDPSNPDYRSLYAASLVGLGEHEQAIELYRGLLSEVSTPAAVADVNLWLAHSLKTIGDQTSAIDSYRTASAARPDFGDAWWSLANLKTYRFLDHEVARMREAVHAPGTTAADRYHLCFALGKALEDRCEYEESWRFYAQGNALKRAESSYRAEIMETNTRLQKEVCTREFLAARADWGVSDPDPVFILGLPRSGSTLLEQILASHPQVEGTQELSEIHRYTVELRGPAADLDHPRYPGVLARLSAHDLRRLGERFMSDTRLFRKTDRPFFIDKMPNNFRHIGLIHLILPNAKIIDARREPLACCFGNLKQLFANGQEFAYSIEDIARYYRTYLELMNHWNQALPGRILTVHHEDVIADLEGSVRRLLEFCGLPFEPACLQFHETTRSVRTASSEQVRRPISREGLNQWRNYEPWLGPLKDELGDALIRYRD